MELIKQQTNLRRLDLENIQIPDSYLIEIAKSCPLLIDLNLSFCYKITVSGVQAIVDGCPMLKRLVISDKEELITQLVIEKYRNIKFL